MKDVLQNKQLEDSLKKRVDELEQTNQFMIDRELKMVELKKEIEELKRRLDPKG